MSYQGVGLASVNNREPLKDNLSPLTRSTYLGKSLKVSISYLISLSPDFILATPLWMDFKLSLFFPQKRLITQKKMGQKYSPLSYKYRYFNSMKRRLASCMMKKMDLKLPLRAAKTKKASHL